MRKNSIRGLGGNLGAALTARPRLRAWLAAAALLPLAAAFYGHYAQFRVPDDIWFLDEAEAFYHGLPILAGLDSMPLTGYYYSLLAHNLQAGWPALFLAFAVSSVLAVSFAAGAALRGRLGGALSAAAAALAFLSITSMANWGRYFETAVFTLLTALAAAALLYYRDGGRTRDAVLLGLLTGCSLLCRSTFFLFPVFILAALWLWRGRLKITWGAAAAIALLPYAMLVPWWLTRAYTGQEFSLFEAFRAKANIITGLLGYIHTIDGSYSEALKLAGLNGSENLWAWGARRLAADPWGLAVAVPLRLWEVLTYNPLLSAAAPASLFLAVMDDKAKLLAAFLFYLIAVHLPMPVEPRYFVPGLPLLAALLARAAAMRLDPGGAAPGGSPAGKAAVYFLAVIALCGTASLYAHLPPYARSIRSGDEPAALLRETAAHPGEPWLLEKAKWARLLDGKVSVK